MKRSITAEYLNYLIGLWNARFPADRMEEVTTDRPNRRVLSRMIRQMETMLGLKGVRKYGA